MTKTHLPRRKLKLPQDFDVLPGPSFSNSFSTRGLRREANPTQQGDYAQRGRAGAGCAGTVPALWQVPLPASVNIFPVSGMNFHS